MIGILAGIASGRRRRAATIIDFSSQSPGALASRQGITCARSTVNATCQSDAVTLITGIAANTIRIESDGTHTYALVEESRANKFPWSNDPSNAALSVGSADTYTLGQSSPDGLANGCRVQVTNAGYAKYFDEGSITAIRTASIWARKGAGSGAYLFGEYYGVSAANQYASGVAGVAWARIALAASTFAAYGGAITDPCIGVASGAFAAGARDVVLYGIQSETGDGATSLIPTAGASATRAHDLLSLDGTPYVHGGSGLSIELDTVAKFASSQFATDQYLARWDANNHIRVQQSNRRVMVTLNGAANQFELPVAIPAFGAGDIVLYEVECGPSRRTRGWVSVNGVVTELGYSPTPQASVPTGTMSILNNGASASGAMGLSKVAFR